MNPYHYSFCLKCGRVVLECDPIVYSKRLDAVCHKECCPAYTDTEPIEECYYCEHYERRVE